MTETREPRREYEGRIAGWTSAIARGERAHLRVSNLRLVTATAAAVFAWLGFFRASLSPLWFAGASIAFLVLIIVHVLILQRNERSVRARGFYLRGLARMDGLWAGTGPDGARFTGNHPYARDLDLFGPSSLFQLLTTARTEAGEDTLADWLRHPAEIDEIRARQRAVDELGGKLDFREDLAVLAAEAHVGRTSGLSVWAKAAPVGLPAWLGPALALAAAAAVAAIVAGLLGAAGTGAVASALLVEAALAATWRRPLHDVVHRIETPALDLRLLTRLIERIEREGFESPRLAALHRTLVEDGQLPSRRLRRLQSLVSVLDSTLNPLFVLPAMVLLVRQQAAVAIEGWHGRHGRALSTWLTAVGELEALSALATFAYEHPGHPFPAIVDDGPRVDARALAHPLIPETSAVANDVVLGGSGPRVLIVSGSNMSGKSTLLRAVGTNVVLALAGGPVRAASMTVSPLIIGATLRVEDSLQAGISRFYAEILRIRAIVEAASGQRPLLFLLDEILHGTNSHDRRIGADAIVRALVARGAVGLVTTHDLALTELAQALDARVSNVHFEDRIENGAMIFDYRMRPGVVEHSNALQLMRAVGLDV
jgi:CBS domain-containing protein